MKKIDLTNFFDTSPDEWVYYFIKEDTIFLYTNFEADVITISDLSDEFNKKLCFVEKKISKDYVKNCEFIHMTYVFH